MRNIIRIKIRKWLRITISNGQPTHFKLLHLLHAVTHVAQSLVYPWWSIDLTCWAAHFLLEVGRSVGGSLGASDGAATAPDCAVSSKEVEAAWEEVPLTCSGRSGAFPPQRHR